MSDPTKPPMDPTIASSLEKLKFYKSIKYKMLTSLLTGTISGFLAGIVITILTLFYFGQANIPSEAVAWMIGLSVISIAMFLWSLYKSLTAKI